MWGGVEDGKRREKVRWARTRGEMKMCERREGSMRRPGPRREREEERTWDSPRGVSGISVVPVCRPLMVHSVSPWRARKTRGVVIVVMGGWRRGGEDGGVV